MDVAGDENVTLTQWGKIIRGENMAVAENYCALTVDHHGIVAEHGEVQHHLVNFCIAVTPHAHGAKLFVV